MASPTRLNQRMFLVPNDGDYNDIVLVSGREMVQANAEDPYILGILDDLKPGQTAYPGGGAAGDFFITRVDGITSRTKNSKYNPLVAHKEYQRVTFEGEGHAKAAKEFAAIVGGRVSPSTLTPEATWVHLKGEVDDVVGANNTIGAQVEKLFEKYNLADQPETGQTWGGTRYFRGYSRTKIAREFAKALGKGKSPITIGYDTTYVEPGEVWPSHKPFPTSVDRLFKQHRVVVLDG